MATKEHKRQAKQAIEGLELRVHRGPPIARTELQWLRDFLHQNDFSPVSDYYSRLAQIQERLHVRAKTPVLPAVKANYGGQSAGRFLQVQSVFDHVIVSTCYEGDFNTRHGRVKISHRFNLEGRIDFVELKFLRSLHPALAGEIRKLLLIREYQVLRKNWFEADAFVLQVLPQELIFLYPDLFRCARNEVLAWLINIGHGIATDLVQDLALCGAANSHGHDRTPAPAHLFSGRPNWSQRSEPEVGLLSRGPQQGDLSGLVQDEIAWPILNKIASLNSLVETIDPQTARVRYSLIAPIERGKTEPHYLNESR